MCCPTTWMSQLIPRARCVHREKGTFTYTKETPQNHVMPAQFILFSFIFLRCADNEILPFRENPIGEVHENVSSQWKSPLHLSSVVAPEQEGRQARSSLGWSSGSIDDDHHHWNRDENGRNTTETRHDCLAAVESADVRWSCYFHHLECWQPKRLYCTHYIKFISRATKYSKASVQVRHQLGLLCSTCMSFFIFGFFKAMPLWRH